MLMLTGPLFGTHLASAAAFGRTRPMWVQLARCTSSTAAFARAMDRAMDTAKRAAQFLHHGVERAGPRSLGNGPKVTPAFQPLHCSDFGVTAL
jgi:hypothetical protein